MLIGERVKELRKASKLTLEKFGERLGVTKTAISNIERGNRGLTDQMLVSICREFDVNEQWLLNGDGEMYTEQADSLIKQVAEKYRLDDFQTKLLDMYLHLTAEQKDAVKKFIKKLNNDDF